MKYDKISKRRQHTSFCIRHWNGENLDASYGSNKNEKVIVRVRCIARNKAYESSDSSCNLDSNTNIQSHKEGLMFKSNWKIVFQELQIVLRQVFNKLSIRMRTDQNIQMILNINKWLIQRL